jgi:MinD superfamily P-loop ATPase
MNELVVISGKGGTGKTSLVGCFAALAGSAVVADCDVDASDLPILLEPVIRERHDFYQGHHATIDAKHCAGCGACASVCRFEAIHGDGPASTWGPRTFRVDPLACEGCGACVQVCPRPAIVLESVMAGEWFVSETRVGTLVHARLGPGGQNSGKLVSQVRRKANELAKARGAEVVLIDGSPGIGCPVIASVSCTNLVLIVTEPTPSGLHDMERVIALTRHFKVPAMLCVNRWDLNPGQAENIENIALKHNIVSAGRIRVDAAFNSAQRERRTVVEMGSTEVGQEIHHAWANVVARLTKVT